jgi:hypothetical protein
MLYLLVLLMAIHTASGTSQNTRPDPNFTFTESFTRTSSFTKSDSGKTEQESEGHGKWSLRTAFPISGALTSGIGPNTKIEIQAGSFKFSGMMKDDPHFGPGKKGADLPMVTESAAGTERTARGTAHVRWSANRVSLSFDGGYREIVAENYLERPAGPIDGFTIARIAFGGESADFDVTFAGTVSRTSTGSRDHAVNTVTVDVTGTGVPQVPADAPVATASLGIILD